MNLTVVPVAKKHRPEHSHRLCPLSVASTKSGDKTNPEE